MRVPFAFNLVLGITVVAAPDGMFSRDRATLAQRNADASFSVIPAKTSFAVGEPVEFVLRVRNDGEETVIYRFSSSCRAFFRIERNGQPIFHSRFAVMCAQVITELRIASGEQEDIPLQWNQIDSGGTSVPAGGYRIIAYLADEKGAEASAPIRVE